MQLRDICPPHKKRDFDALVKQLGGDEKKVQMKIQEWWDEPVPQPQEEEWVQKKNPSSTKPKVGIKPRGDRDRGGRSTNRDGGARDGRGGREGRSQRGGGRDGRGRGGRGGRGDRKIRENSGPAGKEQQNPDLLKVAESLNKGVAGAAAAGPEAAHGVPKQVAAPPLKGAWGKSLGGQPAAPATMAPAPPEKPAVKPQEPTSVAQPTKSEAPIAPSVGIATKNDPTPSGLPAGDSAPAPRVGGGGNVWATKGSAHLIQAEKPKPPIPVSASIAPAPAPPVVTSVEETKLLEPVDEAPVNEPVSALESGLPSSVIPAPAGAAWGGMEPSNEIPSSPKAVISPSVAPPVPSVIEEPVAAPKPAAAKPPRSAPTNVLNMGHWETGDADDSANMDFGFGSFGTDDVAPAKESTPAAPTQAQAAGSASPARAPPGLSITGMPPMPENAVLVHELEHSLENTTLNNTNDQHAQAPQGKHVATSLPPQPSAPVPGSMPPGAAHGLPGQQNYSQYGMGMYNYPSAAAAGSGFVGVPAQAGAPFLAGVGAVPQQGQLPKGGGISPQPGGATPGLPTQNLPPGGIYGHQTAPSSGNAPNAGNSTSDVSNNNAAAPGAPGMPPGMPSMAPYNPQMFYGQQPFHLGQHQGGMGYNYGYGQYGGVQGGFGYQQVMGQGGGYGGPHYGDDQHQQGPPHQGNQGSGGYNKNSGGGGGYRGRNNNNHHNNQYQNQYSAQQHHGYGGQHYGMGYQQQGYGHNMGDPYGMQQQQHQQQGGFQNDDNSKGRRGGNNNRSNNGLQQFQGGPTSEGQEQSFGLQGPNNDSAPPGGAGGWSNSNQAGTGGGWSGAATGGWQQGN